MLNAKSQADKDGVLAVSKHCWSEPHHHTHTRTRCLFSSAVSSFCTLSEEALHWSDSTHQRLRAPSPDHAGRFFPQALQYFRYTSRPSVHNPSTGCPHTCTLAHWNSVLHDTAAPGSVHTLFLPSSLRPYSLTCNAPYVHTCVLPLGWVCHTQSLSSILLNISS